jgi:hypothetical protein
MVSMQHALDEFEQAMIADGLKPKTVRDYEHATVVSLNENQIWASPPSVDAVDAVKAALLAAGVPHDQPDEQLQRLPGKPPL